MYLVIVNNLIKCDDLIVEVLFARKIRPIQNPPQELWENLISHGRTFSDHLTLINSKLLTEPTCCRKGVVSSYMVD